MFRSGFVSLVGRPNVGKSTLVNSLVGEKVAITSDKPQTTRNRIRAILTREEAQVIFIDTPGLHKPKHKLGSYMIGAARSTFNEVDLICFLVEAHLSPGRGDLYIVDMLKEIETPVFLVLNKTDLAEPEQLREHEERYREMYPFEAVYSLSALQGRRLEPLLEGIIALLPRGPRYYPEDMYTDQPERLIVAEIIREKVIQLTREEVPFAIAVTVEEMTLREDKEILNIRAEIFVERESQQGIVIGKGGALLKEVGSLARRELEGLLGHQVYLNLWVKVKRNWRNKEGSLRQFGYD